MIQITLRQIKDCNPCESGWFKILATQGPDLDKPFPLADALESNGLSDTLWALRCLPEHSRLWTKYKVWCARQVQSLMKDPRSINALEVAWLHSDGFATDEELREAAYASAAAYATAAAYASADVSAYASAYTDAAYAAYASADVSAYDTAAYAYASADADAATAAADAYDTAAYDTAREKQAVKLRQILTVGEWVE